MGLRKGAPIETHLATADARSSLIKKVAISVLERHVPRQFDSMLAGQKTHRDRCTLTATNHASSVTNYCPTAEGLAGNAASRARQKADVGDHPTN